MPSILGKVFPLFINVRKWVASLFTSNLLNDFTHVKVKKVCLTHRVDFTFLKKYPYHSKMLF